MKSVKLDYYYGMEANQFAFYKIPKVLFTDPKFSKLSVEAKLLYGLMLDRMEVSCKNNWFDEHKRVFIIYTLEEACNSLNIGQTKMVKIMAELDTVKGVGLIEKRKQGQGKPTIIYVKNFVSQDTGKSAPENTQAIDEQKGTDTKPNNWKPVANPLVKTFIKRKSENITGDTEPLRDLIEHNNSSLEEGLEAKNTENSILDIQVVQDMPTLCTDDKSQTFTIQKSRLSQNETQDLSNSQTFAIQKSRLSKNVTLDFQNMKANNTNKNYTKENNKINLSVILITTHMKKMSK